jgi:uncharacterized membrane protein YjjP (DUF1212 family)
MGKRRSTYMTLLAVGLFGMVSGLFLSAIRGGEDRVGALVGIAGALIIAVTLLVAVNDASVSSPQRPIVSIAIGFGVGACVVGLLYVLLA